MWTTLTAFTNLRVVWDSMFLIGIWSCLPSVVLEEPGYISDWEAFMSGQTCGHGQRRPSSPTTVTEFRFFDENDESESVIGGPQSAEIRDHLRRN